MPSTCSGNIKYSPANPFSWALEWRVSFFIARCCCTCHENLSNCGDKYEIHIFPSSSPSPGACRYPFNPYGSINRPLGLVGVLFVGVHNCFAYDLSKSFSIQNMMRICIPINFVYIIWHTQIYKSPNTIMLR